jgi:hypothetical protein
VCSTRSRLRSPHQATSCAFHRPFVAKHPCRPAGRCQCTPARARADLGERGGSGRSGPRRRIRRRVGYLGTLPGAVRRRPVASAEDAWQRPVRPSDHRLRTDGHRPAPLRQYAANV